MNSGDKRGKVKTDSKEKEAVFTAVSDSQYVRQWAESQCHSQKQQSQETCASVSQSQSQ